VARTHSLLEQYKSDLEQMGIDTYFIRRSEPEDPAVPGLRVATMHRVKGLEFDRVIVAGVNDGIVPYEGYSAGSSDPMVRRDSEIRERALLYVAATRAKKEVLVTSFGKMSRFLRDL
jgi:superfamily I DNA/RNA helicase